MATALWLCTDPSRRRGLFLRLFAILLMASCTDGPDVPTQLGDVGEGGLAIAPSFSFAQGQDESQAVALNLAFDRVNRFRLVLTRIPGGQIALDTIIAVTPGQDSYELEFSVTLTTLQESFTAVLTALEDETVLFSSPKRLRCKRPRMVPRRLNRWWPSSTLVLG